MFRRKQLERAKQRRRLMQMCRSVRPGIEVTGNAMQAATVSVAEFAAVGNWLRRMNCDCPAAAPGSTEASANGERCSIDTDAADATGATTDGV